MSISNHVLVGVAIALGVKQPALVLPLAFASHFVLDALPHFGYEGQGFGVAFKHKLTYINEAFSGAALILLIFTVNFTAWLTLSAAVLAILPDAEWPYRYFLFERKGFKPPSTFLTEFHHNLQWGERSWGIIIEVVFFVVGYLLVRQYLI